MRVMSIVTGFLALVAILLGGVADRVGAQVTVSATDNIFGAGHAVAPAPSGHGGGTLPPWFVLPAGTNRSIQFLAAGLVSYCPPCGSNGPDGVPGSAIPTSVYGGLAGPTFSTRLRYLTGVFLRDGVEPADPAPASLVYTDAAFTETSPALGQIFFIGDGLTGTVTGAQQTIHIPDGATRLFFGFIDYWDTTGLPGGYADNTGSVSVTVMMLPTAVGSAPRPAGQLRGGFPNPFSGYTSVVVKPDVAGRFRLDVYDVSGRLVRTLAEGSLVGEHTFDWDGRTDAGRLASSGVYYVRLITPTGVEAKKLVLAR